MPTIATWWCGQDRERKHVLDNFERMMVGPAFSTTLAIEDRESTMLGSTLEPGQRDALRKRVMMRMVPHPEQVWPRGGIKTVEAWFAFLSLPTGCHPCHTCASPSTIALLPIHYPTSPPQNR